MDEQTLPGTRAQILRVALKEFAARGYHATSVREIAELVGVTKPAVLYHFPSKSDIVDALAEPMLNSLDAALAAVELLDPAEARWATIEGVLEVWLTHRYLIRMNLHDMALASAGPVFERFRDGMARANVLVAGPDPDLATQVSAAQAIAMLADPVVLFADAPTDELRVAILGGVHRLLDNIPVAEATSAPPRTPRTHPGRGRGRGRGRPSVMGAATAESARQMYEAGSTAAEIAAALGVSRATVYRHLAAGGE